MTRIEKLEKDIEALTVRVDEFLGESKPEQPKPKKKDLPGCFMPKAGEEFWFVNPAATKCGGLEVYESTRITLNDDEFREIFPDGYREETKERAEVLLKWYQLSKPCCEYSSEGWCVTESHGGKFFTGRRNNLLD